MIHWPTGYRWLVGCVLGLAAIIFIGFLSLFVFEKEKPKFGEASNANSPVNSNYDNAKQLSELSAAIAEQASKCLVRISVTRPIGITRDKELESYFGQIPIAKGTDTGSGFFFQKGGWILTNYHVVRGADRIQVDGTNGQNWLATLHSHDALVDIAVLKIEASETDWLQWGDSHRLKVGNFVWIGGAPFGLEASMSFGIISSLERSNMNGSPFRDYFQTDASINPGSSGGPMLDTDGKVVGIVTSILGDEYRGIGFALHGDVAKNVAIQLIENRTVKRGWIGVQLGQVTSEQAKKNNLDLNSGAVIEWIDSGDESRVPAKKGGLLAGDICVRCNEMKIASQYDLARKIGMTPPGNTLRLELFRNAKPVVVNVTVLEKP